jgi:hypothetical protein
MTIRQICDINYLKHIVFFSFGHCVVCPSSIDGFWLTLWYLQVLLNTIREYLYMYTVNSNEFTPSC